MANEELTVGMNIACIALEVEGTVYVSGLFVDVSVPNFEAYSQYKNVQPLLAVAVKVTDEPLV